jgi:hypothetical protein
MFTLEITPEQFLRNCSREELIETDLLLQSNHYQMRMTDTSSHGADNKAKELNQTKTI